MHPLLHDPALLAPGDRMSRDEFLARWYQMPSLKFAELIDGLVYMPSPLSVQHGDWDNLAGFLMRSYANKTPVCKATSQPTCLMLDSSPQPDCVLRIRPEFGGLTRIEGKLLAGRPELAVEICVSSRSYDLGPKLDLYRRAGVPEYLAVIVEDKRFEWRVLTRGSYRLMKPTAQGIFRSRIFPGLWIDEAAFWRDDSDRLLAVLNQGLASPEHRRFLESFAGEKS